MKIKFAQIKLVIRTIILFCQDVQWNDIDYMDRALDFTYEPVNFSSLPDLVKDLHKHDQHYVMILVLFYLL